MENTEREAIRILVEQLCNRGLISKRTCEKAVELVYSRIDWPEFFRQSAVQNEGD